MLSRSSRRYKRLLLALPLLLLGLPPLQTLLNMKIFRDAGREAGYSVPVPKPRLSWPGLRSSAYQDSLEQYAADHLGFRAWLIRPRNQLAYSLFGEVRARQVLLGRDEMLFEEAPIKAYLGQDEVVSKPDAQRNARRLRALQDTLARRGKLLVFAIAPNKAAYFPAYLPAAYQHQWAQPSNYDRYAAALRAAGVNLLNFNALFQQWKDTASYPLFPRGGTHWSGYGVTLAADTLLRYLEQRGHFRLPDYHQVGADLTTTPRYTDNDLARVLNLLWEPAAFRMAYPRLVFEAPKPGQRQPRLLVVGDSFVWSFIEFYPYFDRLFAPDSHFWYYNREVQWRKHNDRPAGETDVQQLDLPTQVARHDVFLLLFTSHNLTHFDQGFSENVLSALTAAPHGLQQ